MSDAWRRVESLCHAALLRPAAERAAFLREACGDNDALRQEVESLVLQAGSAASFLETPVIGTSTISLVGRQLGAYRIESSLGAGGMGEVYRAKDTRLGRDVAVKVLPAAWAADEQRRSRFEREARAVAALNHPNICTIHDVGHDQGIDYLVMELVDGETLAARLARGPLPLEEAVARGIEIADALDKAHGQGIVHRDLKPGNIMLARAGSGSAHATHAKLLDFGLARIIPSGVASLAPPTVSSPMTETGAVLGTLQYMAPEQVEGRPSDARTDIFAFGAVLFEMMTGRRAFDGASTAALMAAILREEPPAVHPRGIDRIVKRCLQKDPLRRYQSTRDLVNDLDEVDLDELSTLSHGRLSGGPARWLAVGFLAAAIGIAGYGWPRTPPPGPTYRPLTFQRGVVTGARFSPDEQTVYYSAAFDADPPHVYMTRLEGTGSVRLELPPATLLSVSSKGELALLLTEGRAPMVSTGTLARASPLGGTPRPVLDGIIDADWAPDGRQLTVLRANYDLELPPGRVLVRRDSGWPRFSPGGDRIAYIGNDGVHVADLEGHPVLDYEFPFSFGLAWHPSGREVWFTGDPGGGGADRVLYALSLTGDRRLVAAAPGALTIHDISADGTRALVASGAGWLGVQAGNSDRSREAPLDLFGRSFLVGLSADGKQALLREFRAVGKGLYLRSTDGSPAIRLSDDDGLGLSPDGRWALTVRDQDPAHLHLISTGTGEPRQFELGGSLRPVGHARWSRDGRYIFMALAPNGSRTDDARIYRLDPPKTWRPVTPEGVAGAFAVAPDGGSIAALNPSGTLALFPVDGGEPRLIEHETAIPVAWSPDGWLYLAKMKSYGAMIYRRELATGRSENWRELGPADPTGVMGVDNIFLSDDGLVHVYGYSRALGVLYLIDGLR